MTQAAKTKPKGAEGSAPGTTTTYVNFQFWRVDPAFRRLPQQARTAGVAEFKEALAKLSGVCEVRPYSTVGFRSECDFLLWFIGKNLEDSSRLTSELLKTGLGRYLSLTWTFLGATKPTPYFKRERPQNFEIGPSKLKYMFFYPFSKTDQWFALPLEERTRMMGEHRTVAMQFEKILTNTVYNFGFGDYDFLLAFETDDPREFNDLVQRIRETKARVYTKADTPLIPCLNRSMDELIDSLALL